MGFLRNKEIKRLLGTMLLFVFLTVALMLPFSVAYAAVTGTACILVGAIFVMYTLRRYKAIADLAGYLRQVNNGQYLLEVRDYDEGELSILKSEIYKVTVSLKEQSEKAIQERMRLSDALADISHQFKTPLTSMNIMADLLLEGSVDKKRRHEFTVSLRRQLERLTWLTETLLKLSQLDAGSVVFRPGLVSIRELIDKAASPMLIPMELKEQTLGIRAQGSVYCDLNWTAEALTNVVKNCMEHTPAGGTITISGLENPLFAEIKIRDNGPGIDRADFAKIFNRFYKGKNASPESYGIGLAMAKTILEAQGGSLEVCNASGNDGGAVFSMKFPPMKVTE